MAFQKAREARAAGTAYSLKNAISAYYTEHRKFPIVEISASSDQAFDSSSQLMDELMPNPEGGAHLSSSCPRDINFFTAKVARPIGKGRFSSGLSTDSNGDRKLWDPWGNLFRVIVDANGDKQTENPSASSGILPESILVWSAGPDGDFDTWQDNVKTW